jgi:hypothetical protein
MRWQYETAILALRMQIIVVDAAAICWHLSKAANGEDIFGNPLAGGRGVTPTCLANWSPSQNT